MFKNSDNENLFKEYGYFKGSLLSIDELKKLEEIYLETSPMCELNKQFYTTIWSDNIEFKEQVDTKLKELLMPKLERYFKNYKSVFANFMVKKSGDNSSLPPHQDWSFINEKLADSITIWIPLIDVDENNGALQVCPKSNLLKNYIRPRFQNSPFGEHLEYISNNFMKSIPMKKGEALFMNSRTIHSSPNNLSDIDRIAASIVVIPEKSKIIHYVMQKENNENAYRLNVQTNFFTKYSCFDYPNIDSTKQLIKIDSSTKFENLLKVIGNN